MTNTLAYYDTEIVTLVKRFIVQVLEEESLNWLKGFSLKLKIENLCQSNFD
jgi:hypothetical protein